MRRPFCLLVAVIALVRPLDDPSRAAAGPPAEVGPAVEAAAALRRELEADPLGVILVPELQLDWLDAELAREPLAAGPLAQLERSLRRVLPGRVQQPLDRLRREVGRLARRARLAEEGPAAPATAKAMLEYHLGFPTGTSPVADEDIRQAFQTLAAAAVTDADESAVRQLRERLSVANLSVLLRRDYVETISRRQFSQPVEFQERREGTTIRGRGEVSVALRVSMPPSEGVSRLVVHAVGTGRIDAQADRRRIHVAASAVPQVTGADEVRLEPRKVAVDPPGIDARFTTRVTGLAIDGLGGRCRLVQRVARRAAQEALSANDPAVARRIERTVAEKVEEEAAALAYRINGLVQWGVWDRLAALDFTPEVRLANDELGLRSDTWYGGGDQLGGVSPRPVIPPAELARLDMVTWIHESAVNNACAAILGIRLDEATVRGLWEVQCKLWSPEWDALPPARVPSVITLADDRPVTVRLVPGGLDLVLRATACEQAGRLVDEGPREIRLRYRLARDGDGWTFTRGPADFGGTLPAGQEAAWEETLGLFFGRTIRPLRRYRPTGLSQYLKLGYVDIRDGWLVVAAARTNAPDPDPSPDPRDAARELAEVGR
jgi:hypothetical protein